MTKKPKPVYMPLLTATVFISLVMIGCTNSENKKSERTNDLIMVKKPDSSTVNKIPDTAVKIISKESMADTAKGVKLVCIDKGEDTALNVPRTDVMLYVDGKLTKLETISGQGTLYEKASYQEMGIPANAVSACGAWWAGGGEYFYVVVINGTPVVYQGWQDEGQKRAGYNWKKMNTK
jgi:hypothetical protein